LSLSGFYGEGPRRKAFEMIENGWVEFLGTDMHNTLYAQALIDASHDRKIEKVIESHTFMNRLFTHPEEEKEKKL
jgi:tyrosine-protein phosphatase YwqE